MNINLGNIKQQQKEEKPWKWGKSREGRMLKLPSAFRLSPNKYSPTRGKAPKNMPYCYNVGALRFGCKSCLWRYSCEPEVADNE